MAHTKEKKSNGRNRQYKILVILLVIFLMGCTSRINDVSKVEIYSINFDTTPNTSALENTSDDISLIKIVTNLINDAKKMDIKLAESIFNKYFLLELEGTNKKIYFVIYVDSIDGYFHFENEEVYYQFKPKDVKDLIDSGFGF